MTLTDLSASDLSQAIHERQVSCREVMQAYLSRIHAVNPTFNAIVSLQDGDNLLQQADERDAMLARGESMGWLHGVPQAIKDLSNTAGIPTTLGSPLMREFVPGADSLLTRRMKTAGCIVIGKTNVPEFGLGSHTFNEVFGATRNAFDPTRSAGGSSGGAAVALAQRLLPVADGSDFMGSLRNPAAWNNVFGLRPSQGRVPMVPSNEVWISQLGTEGPMARTVQDLARLLAIQSGFDRNAPLSIAQDGQSFLASLHLDPKEVASIRIGWLGDFGGYLPMEAGILDVCGLALKRLANQGCRIEPVTLGMEPDRIWRSWLVWRKLLVASRIAPFLLKAENRRHIKPEALWEYDQAQGVTGAEFMTASTTRTVLYQRMLTLFEDHDVLALPTAQVWPFEVNVRWPRQIGGAPMDTYHRWMEVVIYATLAGLPCISVPAGFNPDGLPMGLQLIGRPQGDFALLQVAFAYEQVAQDLLQRAPIQQAR